MRKLKVGLALGGGAARGAAHIGILKVLERENIPIHVIAGTSIGAIIGAMYATHPSAVEIERKAYEYIESKQFKLLKFDFLNAEKYSRKGSGFFYKFTHHIKKNIFYNLSLTKRSLISGKEFKEHIEALIEDIDIAETRLKFAAITLDITMGSEVVLKTGSLRRAVSDALISCSVARLFGWEHPRAAAAAKPASLPSSMAVEASSTPAPSPATYTPAAVVAMHSSCSGINPPSVGTYTSSQPINWASSDRGDKPTPRQIVSASTSSSVPGTEVWAPCSTTRVTRSSPRASLIVVEVWIGQPMRRTFAAWTPQPPISGCASTIAAISLPACSS